MLKKIKHHWVISSQDRQNSPTPSASLIGAPDDRGVLNVGGRLGAGHGPQFVRQMLSQFMLGIDGSLANIDLFYGKDINPGPSIEAGHQTLRRAVFDEIRANITPIVVGGGHDYGYPHVAGVYDVFKDKIALINIDAHLDVRPPSVEGITSGSPFYLALEDGIVKPKNFIEFGIQEHCNDVSYRDYLRKKKVEILTLEEVRTGKGGVAANFQKLVTRFTRRGLKVVVSFDIDAVQMAHAPGVSAPQTDGFTPAEFFEMAHYCGTLKDIVTVGFFELAPPLDENQKTTRLVATAIHRFLSGFSQRGAKTLHRPNAVRRLLRRRGSTS